MYQSNQRRLSRTTRANQKNRRESRESRGSKDDSVEEDGDGQGEDDRNDEPEGRRVKQSMSEFHEA